MAAMEEKGEAIEVGMVVVEMGTVRGEMGMAEEGMAVVKEEEMTLILMMDN